MANKLKDIFSNDTPEYKSTINFKDSDAYQSFHTALMTVEREGRSMPIDGIDSISTFMKLPFSFLKNADKTVHELYIVT